MRKEALKKLNEVFSSDSKTSKRYDTSSQYLNIFCDNNLPGRLKCLKLKKKDKEFLGN